MDLRFALLSLCFMLSGASGLVLETLWTQEFGLVFGASELALVAVLAAFMTGLAAGAAAAGPWAQRVRRPLRAYALIELSIGLCALAIPAAIAATGRLEVRLLQTAGLGTSNGLAAATLFQLLSSFLILLVPTALMGATLPLLVGYAVRRDETVGPRVALLYAANTLGAAGGALLCAFVLLPELGLGRATLAGAALSGVVSLLALTLSSTAPPAIVAAPSASTPLKTSVWPLWIVAASGAVALGHEILWTRLFSHVVGGSVYAFATMLATFLTGIGLGALAAAALGRTRASARRGLAITQLGAALVAPAALVLADRVPAWVERLAAAGHDPAVAAAALCACLMLPGSLCLGAAFPLCVRLAACDTAAAARASGRALAWNTAGAVVGATATGLWLLPGLRFAGCITLGAVINLILAAVCATAEKPRARALIGVASAGLLAAGLVVLPTPWNLLRSSPLATVVAQGATDAGAGAENEPADYYGAIDFYAVGRSATVLLHEQGAEWRLTGNGLPESAVEPPGARPGRYAVARWLTLLPGATRSGVRRLLVVGLGAGHSVEDLPPSMVNADVVELEPEVLRANRFLAARRRRDPLADPRVHVHIGDARSALMLGRESFDAIVSQPSHPWTAGSAQLFTREFFELSHARLRPGGVFVQWIGLQFVDEPLMRSLVATLRATFAHVELFQPYPWSAALLVASDQPLETATRAALAVESDAAAWRFVGVFTPEDVLLARVLDDDGTRAFAVGGASNDDHHNRLQTRTPLLLRQTFVTRAAESWIAPLDALRRLPANLDALYVVRRLVELRAPVRALRTAADLPDASLRHAAFALMDIGAGRRLPATAVAEWFDGAPGSAAQVDVRRALVLALRRGLLAGDAPAAVSTWAESDIEAGSVLRAWRLEERGQVRDVRALDAALANIAPRSPLFRAATRLRIAWRAASGEKEPAREGLELLDPMLASRATTGDLLLRARLAAQAGDAATALVSLDELTRATPADASSRRALAREALTLYEAMPSGADALRLHLGERLRAQASGAE